MCQNFKLSDGYLWETFLPNMPRHALIPLGLAFKIKREKIYVMYKNLNLKTPAVECLEKWIPAPENCKNQELKE